MNNEEHMLIIKKKRRFHVPKNLNISCCWNTIEPIIAQEIGASDYTAIPNCFDTNAYKIGHIFVPTSTQIKRFRPVPVLKILGPIRDFVVKNETNTKWLDKKFHSVRTSGDQMHFRIISESGKNQLNFTGNDYYFLNKAHDMLSQGNVTIDRTSHNDLLNITWIGLITDVVITKTSEFRIVKGKHERTLYVSETEHTIFFKYEICKLDQHGVVIESINLTRDNIFGHLKIPEPVHSRRDIFPLGTEQTVTLMTPMRMRWRFKVHHHLQPPPRGGYLRGSKAAQSSMIPSHMFTEHQRSEMRAAGGLVAGGGALHGGPASSWNHASMNPLKKGAPAPAAPKTGAALMLTVRESSAYDAGQPFALSFRQFKIVLRKSQRIIL
ncbi:PREDICTED: uncharacterized protein LOC105151365 [Acromyrmex echinatior]|uniref:uncharacterized protein LOC105151365 n=1 Tax=Acromyrmex echinatior TaxID=103372 RepID=UPI000580BAD0|nr:PREDICTED: uncharacterized protein LOC105151365 [Acromyrmex echinatior]